MRITHDTYVLVALLLISGCGPSSTAPTQKNVETEIRASFEALKQSLTKGDSGGIIRQMSPKSLDIFKTAREFGEDPDAMDAEKLTQLEVLIGFQARWLIGPDGLKFKSAADLFDWSAKNGIVRIGGLVTVDLHDVKSEGNTATAYMKASGTVMTNAVLSFGRYGGKWKLDVDKILLASEPQLATMRAERRISKAETAVLLLEELHKQPIPSLRELLLTPRVRQQITTLKQAQPSQVYDAVIGELSAGRQGDAEDILEVFAGIHTNDQRLAFAQATCSRSRWSKMKSGWQFKRVLDLNPATMEGNCARYMLDLDARRQVTANMQALRLLANSNTNNPLITWLLAIECRDYYKLTGETTYSKESEECYRRLLKIFDVGPVLLHQTFANVLSEELKCQEEALKHRRIAVGLEPKSWTYQGLANTLSAMKRYAEANEAYAKLVELDPHDANYWCNWSGSLSHQGRYDDCIEKNKKAIECDPSCIEAYNSWGYALECQGKLVESLDKFNKAIALNPAHLYAYDAAARVLKVLGRFADAEAMLARKAGVTTGMSGAGGKSRTNTREGERSTAVKQRNKPNFSDDDKITQLTKKIIDDFLPSQKGPVLIKVSKIQNRTIEHVDTRTMVGRIKGILEETKKVSVLNDTANTSQEKAGSIEEDNIYILEGNLMEIVREDPPEPDLPKRQTTFFRLTMSLTNQATKRQVWTDHVDFTE